MKLVFGNGNGLRTPSGNRVRISLDKQCQGKKAREGHTKHGEEMWKAT